VTEFEILKTRIVLAKSIGVNPDDCVQIVKDTRALFSIDYNGYNLIIGFHEVPTIEKAREQIKDLYLAGLELEFDEEMKKC